MRRSGLARPSVRIAHAGRLSDGTHVLVANRFAGPKPG